MHISQENPFFYLGELFNFHYMFLFKEKKYLHFCLKGSKSSPLDILTPISILFPILGVKHVKVRTLETLLLINIHHFAY